MSETEKSEAHRGTGKWAQAGVPHKGWSCVDIEDLGEPAVTCEMCETQEIRFVHHMTHPNYPGELGVGCVCAGRMEENYDAARQRETTARNQAGRKRKWLSRTWRVSFSGNEFLNTDGYNIVVFQQSSGPQRGSWTFRVTNRGTLDSLQARKPYPSSDAAKLRAFDAMIWMKERGR
ncbi:MULTISPECIES: hypothetical protein [Brevundimonas]|uniref:Uncharacterized protein n=1 Tax=Brevundimonas diminuta TaxID=293 RepID=A0A1Z3LWH5_BREDI|nr:MULTISPECIES: hypothetical protein [Brevundimonas]ASD26541.1 hypothetical protein CD943_06320 [Brevundimonas diminuta]